MLDVGALGSNATELQGVSDVSGIFPNRSTPSPSKAQLLSHPGLSNVLTIP